jgi:hypothetical protein
MSKVTNLEGPQLEQGPDPEAYIFGPHNRGNYDQLGLVRQPSGQELWAAYVTNAATCSSLACSAIRRTNFDLAAGMLLAEAETILEENAA